MGYYSAFSGEVVLAGRAIDQLQKYGITAEPEGGDLSLFCEGERTGFCMEKSEPSGFRVDRAPAAITLFPVQEMSKAHGFTDFAKAIHRMWRDGLVKSADLRRQGEDGDDLERYFLSKGKWKTIEIIEKPVNWKPR